MFSAVGLKLSTLFLVVEATVYLLLYEREVDHHAVVVELFGLAVDGDLPVVAVYVLAFAAVVENEVVAG